MATAVKRHRPNDGTVDLSSEPALHQLSRDQPSPEADPGVPAWRAAWHRRVSWCAQAAPCLERRIVDTTERLEELVVNRRDDSATVFVAVAPWAVRAWASLTADDGVRAGVEGSACVDAYFVDVDAVEEAAELLNITTSELPSAHVLHHDPTLPQTQTRAVKRAQKVLASAIDFISLLCIRPVFGVAHLHREIGAAASAERLPSGCSTAFLVCYSGAVWCPPCCRIMPHIRAMIAALNKSTHAKGVHVSVVKADRDASGVVDAVYDVKLIPTFQVFKGDAAAIGIAASEALARLPAAVPDSADDDSWSEQILRAAEVAVKPVDALQNSNVDLVTSFLERHTAPLSFDDEDF